MLCKSESIMRQVAAVENMKTLPFSGKLFESISKVFPLTVSRSCCMAHSPPLQRHQISRAVKLHFPRRSQRRHLVSFGRAYATLRSLKAVEIKRVGNPHHPQLLRIRRGQ
jgi:hypothetical protein